MKQRVLFEISHRVTGTRVEKLAAVREIRDEIRAWIEMWCDEIRTPAETR